MKRQSKLSKSREHAKMFLISHGSRHKDLSPWIIFFMFIFLIGKSARDLSKIAGAPIGYSRRGIGIVFNQQNTRLGKNLTVNVMPVHKDKEQKFQGAAPL
jgi:hypothetical protein